MVASTLTVWLHERRAEPWGPAFSMVRATYPKAGESYPDWVWVRPLELANISLETFYRARDILAAGDMHLDWIEQVQADKLSVDDFDKGMAAIRKYLDDKGIQD